jgi:hypothetical protein
MELLRVDWGKKEDLIKSRSTMFKNNYYAWKLLEDMYVVNIYRLRN